MNRRKGGQPIGPISGGSLITLHAFDSRYNARFHGLRKSLAGISVDLTGDGFTLARILEDNVLRLSPPSLDEARGLLTCPIATDLLARAYTEDSNGYLVELALAPELPPRDAVYLPRDVLPAVVEKYAKRSALMAPAHPTVRSALELLVSFLRHAHGAGQDVLVFSDLRTYVSE
jgi:hypothetical protein